MTTTRRLLLLLPLLLLLVPASASAESSPQWTVSAVSRPTNFARDAKPGQDAYVILVTDTGAAPTEAGEPVTITDELPQGLSLAPGLTAVDELGFKQNVPAADFSSQCGATSGGGVSCTFTGLPHTVGGGGSECPGASGPTSPCLFPGETLVLTIPVSVSAGAAASVSNVVRVSSPGSPAAALRTPTGIFETETQARAVTGFGVSPGGASSVLSTTQAGAHPDLTVSFAVNTVNGVGQTAGNLKNTTFDLPPGFAGDLVDTPACSATLFLTQECPTSTQVGVITTNFENIGGAQQTEVNPVYNLAPEPGKVARLGFDGGENFLYEGDIQVREPGEGGPAGEAGAPYGLKTTFFNTTAGPINLDDVSLTVWGVPGAVVHDPLRLELGPLTPQGTHGAGAHFGAIFPGAEVPFFSNPTSCSAQELRSSFSVISWQHPEEAESPPATSMALGSMTGCDTLVMEPSLTAETSTNAAYSPTGLDVATRIPQTYANPRGLATSTLKKEVVTLPEGMTVNPSSGAGLSACSEAQFAQEGPSFVEGQGCPNSSKLATVKIVTPSLREEAVGSVFLATPAPRGDLEPGRNPFNGLLAVYLVARVQDRGVLIKAPGLVQADVATGQLTTTFDNLPPLPFSLATFEFDQGANAPLVTPPTCGRFTVTAELTPWSNPEGSPLTPEIPPFPITTSCPSGGTPPFAPQVTAGTNNNAAGAYSPLYIRISRNDGEQEITGFASQLPPGLTGNLSGIPFCSEGQVQAATAQTGAEAETAPACPSGSQIGHTIAEAGVGSVLAQTPGRLYLGGPFQGAPFSVVSVTSAKVGPFDLGTVVVHLPLQINPETAQVTIPAGAANQIPHIIKGIVIHLRTIRVYIDREHFMLNPTSCTPTTLSATVIGGGADPTNPAANNPVAVNDPFQAADCSSLAFKPRFSASTEAKDSFNNLGASLKVNLAANQGPSASTGKGVESNIAKVKVELPKSLPSRLTTLQKACTAAQFNADPAGCPAASNIGYATVHTPILPVPLTGPAIFVSHGGEAFPSLILVLQGYGVTIHLVGQTFISKAGITSSTFKTVPDQPFNTFELTLPTGKFSALAAITNVCKPTKTVTVKKKVSVKRHGKTVKVTKKVSETVAAPLLMPTEMVAQNGAVLKQSTKISVTGCKAAKAAKKKKAKKGKKGGKGKKK